ncbi:MAG: glycosyltransferase [Oscillospiraceae bacterium]|nr:glycosyltransferase [Oscillospiraceae bacterium]
MSKKTKVLFLLEGFDKGGIEKVTLDIVNGLDPEKYDITVQTFWYGGHCQSQVADHVKVIPFFFRRYVRGIIRLIDYLSPRMLYRLFVRDDYDVEIACSDGGAAKVISGSTNTRARKVCWVHMDVVERGSKLKEFRCEETGRPIYEKFDVIVPVSDACRDQFIRKFGNHYPIKVVRNPMPVADIQNKAGAFVPDFEKERLNLVCVGRLVEEKGFDRLIQAVSEAKKKTDCLFHIYIVGEGPERNRLEKMISDLGLGDTISLLGFQENPYPYLRNADAFVLSSRDESFSLVIGESLIVGTPVMATDCSGVREWLEDGKYGMVLQNSTEGILGGLNQILANPDMLEDYRSRIPEAQKKISFEDGLRVFEEILR